MVLLKLTENVEKSILTSKSYGSYFWTCRPTLQGPIDKAVKDISN